MVKADENRTGVERRAFLIGSGAAFVLPHALRADDGEGAGGGSSGSPIKVGQIGVMHAHATKLSVYRGSPDFKVVGVAEPDGGRWEAVKNQAAYAGLPRLSVDELLATPGLQVVLVETEVRDLLDTAERCVAAGKHVHLDKPAGESFPQYRRLLAEAESKGLLVQMGYMYRYNPAVVLLQQFLRDGLLGDVFEVQAVMSKVVPPGARKQLAEYPGGIMFELGCHIIDLVVGVLGEPSKVTPFSRHSSDAEDELVDNMLAVLEYPQALATVKSTAKEVDGFARRHLTVCGTKGTFHIQPLDNPKATITLAEAGGGYKKGAQTVPLAGYQRYVGDAAAMARILRGEMPIDFGYEHDLAVQKTVLQASGLALS